MDIICANKDFFKNPDKLPLNELTLEFRKVIRTAKDDISLEEMLKEVEKPRNAEHWRSRYEVKVEKKPAIDKCWIEDEKRYVTFQPFYPQFDDSENEQFLEKNQEFLEILQHLVDCTFHQFWCYVVCDPRVTYVIKDFLQHSVPLYTASLLSEEFLKLYNEIYSCVCSIYERLLKFKISETEYISEAYAVTFLTSSQLLKVRSVLSICYLYNFSNPKFVKRLMDFCLSENCRNTFCDETSELLIEILQELDKFGDDSSDTFPSSVTDVFKRYKSEQFDPVWLEETTLYLLEMASALREFFSMCKPAVEIAFNKDLPQRIPHVYQKTYTELYDLLESKGEVAYDWSRYETLINQWLEIGRAEFVNLFHGFSCHCIDAILGLKDNRQEQENYLEMYIGLISSAMDDELFVRDYNKSHPISVQFQMLVDNVTDFDTTQTDYLLSNLATITVEPVEPENKPVCEQEQAAGSSEPIVDNQEALKPFPWHTYESIYDTLTQYLNARNAGGPSTSNPDDFPEPVVLAIQQLNELKAEWKANPNCWQMNSEQIESAVSSLDKLSLNDKPINKPSEEEIERRIQAVLEMLPDLGSGFILKCLERMDYKPEQVISKVLDGDLPLDLVEIPQDSLRGPSESPDMPGSSRDVQRVSRPKPKIIEYVGKKPGYADARDLLDDKQEKQDIKQLVLQASYKYDLDDDYDDRNEVSYSFERGDDSKIYRHLKDPEFTQYNNARESSSSSEDESQPEKPSNAFCEDPAVIRARRAAQRGRVFKGPSRDVVGKPKGQGQENTVQHNREKKTVNKSSRANHNRKGGAQWKRNKGMIPS